MLSNRGEHTQMKAELTAQQAIHVMYAIVGCFSYAIAYVISGTIP